MNIDVDKITEKVTEYLESCKGMEVDEAMIGLVRCTIALEETKQRREAVRKELGLEPINV